MHHLNPMQQRAESQARPSIPQGVRSPYLEGPARGSAAEENAPPSSTTLEGRARESVFFEATVTLTNP